jgi:hypothetical protein
MQVLVCPPLFGAPPSPPGPVSRELPWPPQGPPEIDGSIQVDGGAIIISPTGELTHVQPPRQDPLPMVQSPAAVEHLAELLYGRHVHANAGELDRVAARLAPDLLRRHVQAIAATLATRLSEAP